MKQFPVPRNMQERLCLLSGRLRSFVVNRRFWLSEERRRLRLIRRLRVFPQLLIWWQPNITEQNNQERPTRRLPENRLCLHRRSRLPMTVAEAGVSGACGTFTTMSSRNTRRYTETASVETGMVLLLPRCLLEIVRSLARLVNGCSFIRLMVVGLLVGLGLFI